MTTFLLDAEKEEEKKNDAVVSGRCTRLRTVITGINYRALLQELDIIHITLQRTAGRTAETADPVLSLRVIQIQCRVMSWSLHQILPFALCSTHYSASLLSHVIRITCLYATLSLVLLLPFVSSFHNSPAMRSKAGYGVPPERQNRECSPPESALHILWA